MPSPPMTRPLNTEVRANDTPVTVPTMPLARSRRSSATSRVTLVDRAMPRIWPATEPSSVTVTSSQNHGLPRRSRSLASTARNTIVATAKLTVESPVVTIMAVCLRWRSTNVPNAGPSTAAAMLNAPPIAPVATTERVSR